MKWNVQQMAALSLLGEDERGAILVFPLSVCVCECVRACVFNRMCSPLPESLCFYQGFLFTLNI